MLYVQCTVYPLTTWGRERKTASCRKILLIEAKANCRHLKKLTCKVTSRQVFIRVCTLEIHVGVFNPAL
jgi:hypothetical protein